MWTGAHDFGGATSLKVPNSDAPTVDAAGEIAFDNNLWAAGRGASVLYDGTASTAILSALVSDAPANGEVPKWNTGGTITWETDNNTAGLTGTDTHVLFFDGADNAVGEAGMTYNKTTDTLSVGAVETAPTATPTIANYDSDGTDGDISSQQVTNLTDTGSGTEDADVTFSQQIAGAMTAFITADADGSTTIARLAIPSGAAVTEPAAAGQVAIDTTSDQLLYYGGAQRVIAPYYEISKTLEDPVEADDNIPFWHPTKAIEITDVYCEVEGATSIGIIISDGTNALEEIICTEAGAADDGSIANGAFTANERMEVDMGTISGTPDWVSWSITYVITAD